MADTNTTQPISAPLDGQIALTAHNNGDGTWSVKRGPDGPVLQDGLAREKALAIVGGATGPHEPVGEQEEQAAAERAALEQKEAEREEKEVFAPDASRDPLDHDGNGKKGGSAAAVSKTAGEGPSKTKNGTE